MSEHHVSAICRMPPSFDGATTEVPFIPRTGKSERLPFTISLVQSEEELRKAVHIRCAAYSRHLPELGDTLKMPEPMDYDDDTVVLLAQSKLDGAALGSVRIQRNMYRPLSVEHSIALPPSFAGRKLAEVTRLGVDTGRLGRLVKISLVKACFQYCELNGIDWAIAAGRAPIDRHYAQLLFEDLFPERGFIPLQHAANIPHRVMGFEIATGHARWVAAQHPLLEFFSHTRHADICVEKRRSVTPVRPAQSTVHMPSSLHF